MCGIAGWYNRDGKPIDSALVQRMSSAIRHRGPDGDGLWIDDNIALAHRRLAIRDLSAAGYQPMADAEERIFVTFNGEIYNDRELRSELERDFGFRFRFRTTCDTEILPYAYLAWGDRMFDRLEGMFAIGLWDRARKQLILARDGIGIKPVYYAATGTSVIFASEVKGILASTAVADTLDLECLHTYFAAGHAGTNQSLLAAVKQVPPGGIITFSASSRSERQFWAPRRSGGADDMEQALERLLPLLESSVTSQLISDVPLGVLQSGESTARL